MKKIIFLTSYPVISTNGAHLCIFEYLNELQGYGHETSVYSLVSSKNKELFYRIIASWNKRFSKLKINKDFLSFYYQNLHIEIIFLDSVSELSSKCHLIFEKIKPDIGFIGINDSKILSEWKNFNKPCIIFFADNEFPKPEEVIIPEPSFFYTLSPFLKQSFEHIWGKNSEIIFPLIPHDNFKITENTKEFITFINPVDVKGLSIFLSIANLLTDKKFLVVGGWNETDRAKFKKILPKLKNVTYLEPVDDIREVLSKTKILLVPSLWEEGFGRVVIEAFINGIPVIANNTGWLKETVGSGGYVIPFDKSNHLRYLNIWIEKIQELDNDNLLYNEISKLSVLQAEKYSEIAKNSFIKFEQLLTSSPP